MRPIKVALCAWLLGANLFAATATSGIQWEVRTGGSDLNGSGFNNGVVTACVGGTDYSLSDTPHVTFDGASPTATTSGTSSTIVITGYTVATTDICNTLQIASGTNFTPDLYPIIGVNVGANTWTLDRAVSSGAGLAMVGRMGGGFLTIAKAATNWQGQDAIWVQTGTYNLTTTITPASSVVGGPFQSLISGYGTTHGDTGTATITSSTNGVALFTLANTFRYSRISNFNFTHTAGTRGDCIKTTTGGGLGMSFLNSTFDGCQIGINITNDGTTTLVSGVEIKNSISHAISTAWSINVQYSNIHNNGGTGLRMFQQVGQGSVIESLFNVFRANDYCITTTADTISSLKILNNDCVNSVNDGILFGTNLGGAGTWQAVIRNNILYGNGTGGTGYGINGNSGVPTPSVNDHNAYGANANGAFNIWNAGTGDVTLTADPFVARTGGNFALNTTVGGGAALKGAAFPGTIPNAGTGISDIGALESGTGGATTTVCSSSCVQ